jgi:Uncharacterized protein conserved in bacteria
MSGWKPDLYPSLSPYLICPEAEALIAFLGDVFDGRLLRRFDRPDGSLMHAEVLIDDSVVMIGGGPTEPGARPVHLHVYVQDVETVFARALAAGATAVQEPVRQSEDDFRGGFLDGFGQTWWVASQT